MECCSEELCLLGCYTATRRNIPEDTILHSHRRENLKSYGMLLSSRLSRFIFPSSIHADEVHRALGRCTESLDVYLLWYHMLLEDTVKFRNVT
jgi:hypothetical protein